MSTTTNTRLVGFLANVPTLAVLGFIENPPAGLEYLAKKHVVVFPASELGDGEPSILVKDPNDDLPIVTTGLCESDQAKKLELFNAILPAGYIRLEPPVEGQVGCKLMYEKIGGGIWVRLYTKPSLQESFMIEIRLAVYQPCAPSVS